MSPTNNGLIAAPVVRATPVIPAAADRSSLLPTDGEVFRGQLDLPPGDHYYCSVWTPTGAHVVAIDERGMVFDPSTNAPMTVRCTLAEYLEFNRKSFGTIRVSCCYRVRAPGQLKG